MTATGWRAFPDFAAGAMAPQEVSLGQREVLPLNRLHDILMRDRARARGLEEWAQAIVFELHVGFTDYGLNRFESFTRFRFEPVGDRCEVLEIGAVKGVR